MNFNFTAAVKALFADVEKATAFDPKNQLSEKFLSSKRFIVIAGVAALLVWFLIHDLLSDSRFTVIVGFAKLYLICETITGGLTISWNGAIRLVDRWHHSRAAATNFANVPLVAAVAPVTPVAPLTTADVSKLVGAKTP